jgi:hypothetical protein
MAEILILPTDFKVCATCSYWDGERRVDPEMKLVVVTQECEGECLVTEQRKPGLHDIRSECECLWEDIEAEGESETASSQDGEANGDAGR